MSKTIALSLEYAENGKILVDDLGKIPPYLARNPVATKNADNQCVASDQTGDLYYSSKLKSDCNLFPDLTIALRIDNSGIASTYFPTYMDKVTGKTYPKSDTVCFYYSNKPKDCVTATYDSVSSEKPQQLVAHVTIAAPRPNLNYRIKFFAGQNDTNAPTLVTYDPRVPNKPDLSVVALVAKAFGVGFVAGNVIGVAATATLLLFAAVGLYFTVRGGMRMLRR